jgi:Tfp pilus assembly protein PilX
MRRGTRSRASQRGIILFIALIVLVAMTLTGIALMRSVDSNVMVAGNLAFRQGATSGADWGIEAARAFVQGALNADPAALDNDNAGAAYYATWQAALDLYGATATTADDFNWTASSTLVGTDTGGNEVRYVVQRLCQGAGGGTSAAANCVKTSTAATSASGGGTMGAVSYSTMALPPVQVIYYRVTVRVFGPRNTLSYVQTILR